MSEAVERYFDYHFNSLIHGFCRQSIKIEIPNDISNTCCAFLLFPDNQIIAVDIVKDFSDFSLLPNKIEYLILKQLSLLINDESVLIADIISPTIGTGWKWSSLKTRYPITDKKVKLTNSMTRSVSWMWSMKYLHFVNQDIIDQKKLYVLVCDIVIELWTKGIYIKYPLILPLIEMYDKYYFDIYILRFIKRKIGKLKSKELIKIIQNAASQILKERYLVDIDINDENELKKWNNNNSMKLLSMLQIANMAYKDNVDSLMIDLYDIKDALSLDLNNTEKEFWDNTKYAKMRKKLMNAFNNTIIIPIEKTVESIEALQFLLVLMANAGLHTLRMVSRDIHYWYHFTSNDNLGYDYMSNNLLE